ncbi:unnamed protein product [Periconia digitata]|uniref:Heterokaryon incompatibility domain-containing protein n=1 Tax=Periconia digitata TaxID=1303443 RepID=A0A9W4XN90_9PLEO|nr:unnamed protein product [Periconia digitata]
MTSEFARPHEGNEATQSTKRDFSRIQHDSKDTDAQDEHSAPDMKRSKLDADQAIAVGEPTGDQHICQQCRDLNLPALAQAFEESDYKKRRYPTPWVGVGPGYDGAATPVGIRYMSSQDSTCMICRVLAASRLEPGVDPQDKESSGEFEGDELWAFPFRYMSPLVPPRIESTDRSVYLVLVPHKYLSVDSLGHHISSEGCAALFLEEIHPTIYTPQLIRHSFSPYVVKPWLQYCLKNHRRLCNAEAVPVSGMQVIDCMTRYIEDYEADTPYITLSYVWASSGNACGSMRTIDGKKSLPEKLSAVIADSIEVTKSLGYRYLWIDKFCIDQNAPDLKHEQIKQMDRIYQSSELTIIGAAGQDETYGLPGVGVRERAKQLVAKLDGATVLWTPKDPHEAILSSHWSTRGWTFQEAALSCRRLVFTDDQVYFQCNTMNCFESVSCPLDELHISDKSMTYDFLRAGVFGGISGLESGSVDRYKFSPIETLEWYAANVEEYSTRNLRFDEDSLNAFKGIIRQFSKQQHSLLNSWGLAYPAEQNFRAHYFAWSLTWKHINTKKGLRRRPLFPSWTWAGWQGKVWYPLWAGSGVAFESGLREIILQSPVDESVRLEDISQENMDVVGEYRLLRVTANTIAIAPDSYQPKSQERRPWVISGRRAILYMSANSQNDAELCESFQDTARWQFIYIGRDDVSGYVMVLESLPGSNRWQRSGLLELVINTSHNDFWLTDPSITGQSTFLIE